MVVPDFISSGTFFIKTFTITSVHICYIYNMRFKTIIFSCALFFMGFLSDAQSDFLAKDYFEKGEFEKALISYQKLYEKNKGNLNYLIKIVEIHQQLENYDISEKLLSEQVLKGKDPQFLVELGYNYHLKGNDEEAVIYYEQAIIEIEQNPVYTFYVARRFEEHALIEYAAQTYERAMAIKPDANFNIQLARIYGEQGKVEKMFTSYINFVETNTTYLNQSKRIFSDFISEDPLAENNKLLRKVLLKKIQASPKPDALWNQMLSWLFIQQRDYDKAFTQEKAIFRRDREDISGILDLADIAIDENEVEVATDVLNYIIENAAEASIILQAHRNLLELKIDNASVEDYAIIENEYKSLLNTYGRISQTLELQIDYGHFIAFYLDQPETASTFLKETLDLKLNRYQLALVKMELGDILVFQEKFNEALIYFTQIQTNGLKNSTISQQARFKVAQTSYYKGDFKWAESQLKILKSSTSQLIANDALDLKLLISDNNQEDSTHTALKLYAKSDLLAFQNKPKQAITLLDQILDKHKTETIIDQALYFQAQLFEKEKQFDKAKSNYEAIIENYKEDILIDDAYFALAELLVNHYQNIEEAKLMYEQIIFNHEDSIYFVESRKKYRTLRGDEVIN